MAIREVTFRWSDEHGQCYDCGDPAAYALPERYGRPRGSEVRPEDKLCSVCFAASAYIDFGVGQYLFHDEVFGDGSLDGDF